MHPLAAVKSNVTSDLASTRGVADHHGTLEIGMFEELRQIVRIRAITVQVKVKSKP